MASFRILNWWGRKKQNSVKMKIFHNVNAEHTLNIGKIIQAKKIPIVFQ
jgi:hypothetical protein